MFMFMLLLLLSLLLLLLLLLLALLLLLTLAMILAEKLKVMSRKERKPNAEKLLPGPHVPPDLGSVRSRWLLYGYSHFHHIDWKTTFTRQKAFWNGELCGPAALVDCNLLSLLLDYWLKCNPRLKNRKEPGGHGKYITHGYVLQFSNWVVLRFSIKNLKDILLFSKWDDLRISNGDAQDWRMSSNF